MSCSSDSDKWLHPSNMNFAVDRGGGQGVASHDHFICTKRVDDM